MGIFFFFPPSRSKRNACTAPSPQCVIRGNFTAPNRVSTGGQIVLSAHWTIVEKCDGWAGLGEGEGAGGCPCNFYLIVLSSLAGWRFIVRSC